jgi:hypothetical protein
MTNNINTEQNLNEEQLQVITGGCQECDKDLQAANVYLMKAKIQIGQAQEAMRIGGSAELVHSVQDQAAHNLRSAHIIHDSIINSGHVDVSKLPR